MKGKFFNRYRSKGKYAYQKGFILSEDSAENATVEMAYSTSTEKPVPLFEMVFNDHKAIEIENAPVNDFFSPNLVAPEKTNSAPNIPNTLDDAIELLKNKHAEIMALINHNKLLKASKAADAISLYQRELTIRIPYKILVSDHFQDFLHFHQRHEQFDAMKEQVNQIKKLIDEFNQYRGEWRKQFKNEIECTYRYEDDAQKIQNKITDEFEERKAVFMSPGAM